MSQLTRKVLRTELSELLSKQEEFRLTHTKIYPPKGIAIPPNGYRVSITPAMPDKWRIEGNYNESIVMLTNSIENADGTFQMKAHPLAPMMLSSDDDFQRLFSVLSDLVKKANAEIARGS